MGLVMAPATAQAGAREHEDGVLGGAVHLDGVVDRLAGVDHQVLEVAALVLAQLPVSIFVT